jgi:hypothetical protein
VNCETASPITQPKSSDYADAIQLAAGNEWVFEVVETNLATGSTTKLENEMIHIIDHFRKDDNDVYSLVGPTYFWERGVTDSAGNLLDFYSREIIFSGVKLDQKLYENNELRVSMTNTDTVINVPVGTFKTANYKREDKRTNEISSHFYANGVGLIKQIYQNHDKLIEHNLIKYTVKGK